jgi:hypothetical protein
MSTRTLYEHDQHFSFGSPVDHAPDCRKADVEAKVYRDRSFDHDVRETVIRAACLTCGEVTLYRIKGEPDTERTTAANIGYGCKPEKVTVNGAVLFLHAGRLLWRGQKDGPVQFYVTSSPARPAEPADVLGVVAWSQGPRGGIRWSAGLGYTRPGTCERVSGDYFTSRRSALAWIAGQLAAQIGGAK